jgi:hypothetical protein
LLLFFGDFFIGEEEGRRTLVARATGRVGGEGREEYRTSATMFWAPERCEKVVVNSGQMVLAGGKGGTGIGF